jgi:hypothetical protein
MHEEYITREVWRKMLKFFKQIRRIYMGKKGSLN